MKWFQLLKVSSLTLILSGVAYAGPATDKHQTETFTARELLDDLTLWREWVGNTHPDLSYSVDLQQLDARMEVVRASLVAPMTRRQAWQELAILNSVLNDGHLGIRFPVDDFQAYLKTGGQAFPLEVVMTADNQLRTARDYPGIAANTPIHRINGRSASDLVEAMLARARGDNDDLRRELIARRFPGFYWSLTGATKRYEIELGTPGKLQTISLTEAPQSAARNGEGEHFRYSTLKHQVGYLYIDTFDKDQQQEFADFLERSFSEIQQQQIQDLIIDLRDNGGGSRDLSDQLVNYLTAERVSPISGVKARVVAENQNMLQGAELGSVVTTPYRQWYQPDADHPLRFEGNVILVIGAFSYSQAISFATEMQDFEIAILAGEPTAGRANQTAQVQHWRLPKSGLEALAPIYIMLRASGDKTPGGVQPDIFIVNNPTNSNATIDSLIERVLAARNVGGIALTEQSKSD